MIKYKFTFSCMMMLLGFGLIALLLRRNETVLVMNGIGSMVESQRIHDQRDGVELYYPKIISGGTTEDRSIWNQIIADDLERIINIYSFRPYPSVESGQREIPTVLSIDYELKSQGERFYSILYKARYSSSYVAHPTELVYTTNIDLTQNKRLRLKDLVAIDAQFVKEFRSWDLVGKETLAQEVIEAAKTYLKEMTDQDLLQGFQNADLIGSENGWGVFSYIIPDGIGISLSVPPYLGDHLEFEHHMKLRYTESYSSSLS